MAKEDKRKSFEVTRNNARLTVYPYKKGWRYGWRRDERSKWQYTTCRKKADAEASAWEKLGEIAKGGILWSTLPIEELRFLEDVHRLATPADFPAVVAFLESRRRSSEIVASVTRFLDEKVAEYGGETRHLWNVKRELTPMAQHFAGRSVVDISDEDLKAWWQERVIRRDEAGQPLRNEAGVVQVLSEKTRNDVRGHMVAFWNWAIEQRLHPKDTTAADRLPAVKVPKAKKRVLTVAEMKATLREVKPQWRAFVVLSGFFGLRPEEIAPNTGSIKTRKDKRGLLAEEIDWRFRCIRVPEEVSKVSTARNVPFFEGAEEWLRWAGLTPGMMGRVCRENPTRRKETARLGKLIFKDEGWPQDALRHSYGSYRNSLIRNLSQVAEEMGTSVDMLRRHYHNPKALEEGEEWFAMRPGTIRCDPMESGSEVRSQKMGGVG